MAHQAGAYPGFYSMKQLRVFIFYFPVDGLLVTITPPTSIHFYSWVAGEGCYM